MGFHLTDDWGWLVTVAAFAIVGVIVLILFLRVRTRGARFRRLAKREGLTFLGKLDSLPRTWSDLECLRIAEKGRTLNCVAGERGGRAVAMADHHYDVESFGSEARAHMGMQVTGPAYWGLLKLVDETRDPGFSVAVVDCDLPSGVSTVDAKRALAPWRAEFGTHASVIRLEDGYCAPDELLAAADRLNEVLDLLVSPAAPRAR